MKDLTFNAWSIRRIEEGRKFCTSRSKPNGDREEMAAWLDAAGRLSLHKPSRAIIKSIRSLILSRKVVSREWVDRLFYQATLGTTTGPYQQRTEEREKAISMLREIGIEVEP